MIGAELLLRCLEKEGVEKVFGIPGGVLIPLYDVLHKSPIEHILTRHEQGAAHAADGYARSTGRAGVCFATSGPGATNLITGIATAYMDSVPMVAITGQVARTMLGKDSFQEADSVGISQPVTKHNYLLDNLDDMPGVLEEAFYVASSGRPGPVLIDIPTDILKEKVRNYDVSVLTGDLVRPSVRKKLENPPVPAGQLEKAAAMLSSSRRPMIFAGGGVISSEASAELEKFALEHNIPVAVTLMGKGVFPADSPLFLGMVGMHGTFRANWAVQNSDCILAVGMRFDDRVTGKLDTFAPKAKIIHVDIDASEIDKNRTANIPVVSDCGCFFRAIEERGSLKVATDEEWLRLLEMKADYYPDSSEGLISPQRLIESLNRWADDDTIFVTDVGQHQMWAALCVHPKGPRKFLTSGGLGTMGYGLPAAIGAQVANPDKRVVLITGDGSFQMNIQELALLRKLKLPVKMVLVNNGYLGMVRQWQEMFYDKNYSETCLDVGPDWVKLAEAYAIEGGSAEKSAEVPGLLEKAFADDRPWLMDFRVDSSANVFPMVPAGCSLDQIIGRWDNEAYSGSVG